MTRVPLYAPFLGVLMMLPILFCLYAVYRLWQDVMTRDQAIQADQAERHSIRGRMGRLLKKVFGFLKRAPVDDEPETQAPQGPPAWLVELLSNHLPPDCEPQGGPRLIENRDVSPVTQRIDLKPFFGGHLPTQDQVDLFDRFVQAYADAVNPHSEDADRSAAGRSPDLLVEGEPGSGRTTSLLACAVYAALARGQRVLFIVPDALRREIVARRVTHALGQVGLQHYLKAGTISRRSVAEWIAGSQALPHILIGTLQAVESELYGAPYQHGVEYDRLRRLIHMIETVIVDDFMEFDDAERSHLPFMLDKHRLLMAAENVPIQVVAVFPRLSEIAKPIVGTRLFTERGFKRGRNVLTLHPRPIGKAWRVDLRAADVPRSADHLIEQCLRMGLNLVVYRRGIDEHERRRQESKYRHINNGGRLTVLSHLDQAMELAAADVAAILHQAATHENVCLAFRLAMGSDDTVILSIQQRDDERPDSDAGIIPILADRSASPLLTAHLRNGIGFLRPHVPIPLESWRRWGSGFDLDALPLVAADNSDEVVLEYDAWNVPHEYGNSLWPYIALRTTQVVRKPVRTRGLPDASHSIYRRRGNDCLYIRRSPQASLQMKSRKARWVGSDGQEIAEIDLAHLRELRLVVEGDALGCSSISPVVGAHPATIHAEHWHGDGNDHHLPVWSLALTLPTGQTAAHYAGGPQHGLCWFELKAPPAQVATASCGLIGRMTEFGLIAPNPSIRFDYSSHVHAILFGPPVIPADRLAAEFGKSMAGQWTTSDPDTFMPGLTYAMNYALEKLIPGMRHFARAVSFRLPLVEGKQPIITLLFEPLTSGRTSLPILHRLLANIEGRSMLFQTAMWLASRAAHSSNGQFILRRFARVGFEGDEGINDLALAVQLLESAIAADPSTP